MKKLFVAVAIAIAVGSVVLVLPAGAKGLPPNYVTLKFGGFFPQSSDLKDIDANAGFNGEIALGHSIAPGFSIEGGVGYFETKGGGATPFGRADEKFQVIPVTISIRGQVPYGKFEPYGFIGLGAYFIKDKISGAAIGSASENDTGLGFHVGVGGSYTLPNNMLIGVETRYLFLETDTFGVNFKMNGISLTGNIGYRF